MADQKISELINITGANLANADEFVVVDTSADQTKAVTRAEFFKNTPSIDVTGTVTADGLTVSGPDNVSITQTHTDGNVVTFTQSGTGGDIDWRNANGDALIRTAGANRLLVGINGDISFYEDTGTTPKLKWSASNESLNFADNSKAVFGASSDLQIYHSGTHSFIEDTGTGNLYIDGSSSVIIRGDTASTISAIFNDSGAVDLRYNGVTKFDTTSTGVDVTGTVTADGLTLGDNDKAVFGAGSDLQIYHQTTGTVGSYIAENGSGDLRISGNNLWLNTVSGDTYFRAVNGSYAKIYHAGAEKLATTATGIDVTGTITADGLTVGGINAALSITGPSSQLMKIATTSSLDQIAFATGDGSTEAMRIDASGSVLVGKTAAGVANNGFETASNGNTLITRTSGAANVNTVLTLNRRTTDGNITEFKKDGITVGSIGSKGGSPYFITTDGGFRIAGNGALQPATSTGAVSDALEDLGSTAGRWRDLYLSGGVYLGRDSGGATLYTSRRVDSGAGGAIFATVVTGKAQMGELYAYDTATNGWCHYSLKKNTHTANLAFQQISGTGLTINATNAGGTIALSITASTVKMVVTIWVVEN